MYIAWSFYHTSLPYVSQVTCRQIDQYNLYHTYPRQCWLIHLRHGNYIRDSLTCMEEIMKALLPRQTFLTRNRYGSVPNIFSEAGWGG